MFGNDTISSICTAVGESAIAIIRISGEKALHIAEQIFKAKSNNNIIEYSPNTLIYGHIVNENGDIIDEVFCVYMKKPYSYTAEDVVEIQCHGGIIAVKKILSLIYKNGARPANPGEFTQRAFLNGRIDLTQAEGVMSIIKARSESALKQALLQQQGVLSDEIKNMRNELKEILVTSEATIDYPEEDLESTTIDSILLVIQDIKKKIDKLLKNAETGRIIKEGLRTVIIGKPNVGKSSLLNLLSGIDRAIVTDIAGTTRDVIEETLLFEGIPVVLVDTAGIRKTDDKIEKIGIEKSQTSLQNADIILFIIDGSKELTEDDLELFNKIKNKPHIIIVNKCDLSLKVDMNVFNTDNIVFMSILNSEGLNDLADKLKTMVYGESKNLEEGIYIQEMRHKELLFKAKTSIDEAIGTAENHMPIDCLLIDIKDAFNNLGMITGETINDEIIKEIFSRFCLGK